MTLSRRGLRRKTGVRKVNRKRKASNFARAYHSEERVKFVKSLPCAACGVVGYSENAHVCGNGGMSRKADYTTIAPLCGVRPYLADNGPLVATLYRGCHGLLDRDALAFAGLFPEFNAEQAAADTEAAWLTSTTEPAP